MTEDVALPLVPGWWVRAVPLYERDGRMLMLDPTDSDAARGLARYTAAGQQSWSQAFDGVTSSPIIGTTGDALVVVSVPQPELPGFPPGLLK